MRTQALVQLSDDLLATLDERAASEGRSRSELIRRSIECHLADSLGGELDRQIVSGYKRLPPADVWGEIAAIEMIEAEPW